MPIDTTSAFSEVYKALFNASQSRNLAASSANQIINGLNISIRQGQPGSLSPFIFEPGDDLSDQPELMQSGDFHKLNPKLVFDPASGLWEVVIAYHTEIRPNETIPETHVFLTFRVRFADDLSVIKIMRTDGGSPLEYVTGANNSVGVFIEAVISHIFSDLSCLSKKWMAEGLPPVIVTKRFE